MGLPPDPLTWIRRNLAALWTDPVFRPLRWALMLGLVVRLLLAPVTSWSTDTTGFAIGDITFVFLGNPYSSGTLFNPPLAAFLQTPIVWVLLLFYPPQSLVTFAPSLLPASSAIGPGFISPWVASPAMLLALKLPLILADSVASLALAWLAVRVGRRSQAPWVGVAYALNPLAIWVSSVHAEPDGLAALLVILFIIALSFKRFPIAGALLGLAVFTKAYPVILLPIAAGGVLAMGLVHLGGWRQRARGLLEFSCGIIAASLPFLPYLQFLNAAFGRATPVGDYGGLSVLVLYNSGTPPLDGFTSLWKRLVPGQFLLLGFELTAAVTVAMVVLVLLSRSNRWKAKSPHLSVQVIGTASLAVVASLLLAYPAPQPENLLAVVPLGLAVSLWAGTTLSRLTWILSLAGFAQYMVFGTPLQGFTPLLLLLGPGSVRAANSIFSTYGSGGYGAPPSYYWFVPGILAGAALICIWLLAAWWVIPREWREGVRRRLVGQRHS
ncbi:MAG TPA: hypothetical protein VFG07_08750 [Thermoplasmata archaeon]|nr:hypothetical protein [Thermoplasmata archaeon]